MQHGELMYGLVLAVDLENFSRLSTLDQYTVQSHLADILDTAAQETELDRGTWCKQVRGDGEMSILPADIDVAWVVARFTQELERAIERRKDSGDSPPPLRLRMAMHYGTFTHGRFGPVGQAPIVACRLLDAKGVRQALANDLDTDVVLVISESIYRDVVETRFYGLDPAGFDPLRVTAKGRTYLSYVRTSRSPAQQIQRCPPGGIGPPGFPDQRTESDHPLDLRLLETG